jgi:hypothetical protein
MNFDIPDGANVHIFIGNSLPLALTDQRAELPRRSRRGGILSGMLKVAVIGVLVIGGFWVGEQRGQAASDAAGFTAPPPVEQAFPSQAAAAPPPLAPPPSVSGQVPPGQVPPSFAAQLQQPPTIQPPPGQNTGTAAGNGPQSAFGLQN